MPAGVMTSVDDSRSELLLEDAAEDPGGFGGDVVLELYFEEDLVVAGHPAAVGALELRDDGLCGGGVGEPLDGGDVACGADAGEAFDVVVAYGAGEVGDE